MNILISDRSISLSIYCSLLSLSFSTLPLLCHQNTHYVHLSLENLLLQIWLCLLNFKFPIYKIYSKSCSAEHLFRRLIYLEQPLPAKCFECACVSTYPCLCLLYCEKCVSAASGLLNLCVSCSRNQSMSPLSHSIELSPRPRVIETHCYFHEI